MTPAYDQYRASIERAEQHEGIVYVEKDHAQIWKEIMGNKDILMQSWRSSVLIRNGRLAVPKQKKVGTFSHPLEFDHELTKVLRKIQKTLAS